MNRVMQDEPVWKAMYAAGERLYGNGSIAPPRTLARRDDHDVRRGRRVERLGVRA